MNSHTAALNIQSSGQTAVVGHHRGFSQSGGSSTAGDPWFLQASSAAAATAHHHHLQQQQQQQQPPPTQQLQQPPPPIHHPMPPTAPLRQHKRPAPQPTQLATTASVTSMPPTSSTTAAASGTATNASGCGGNNQKTNNTSSSSNNTNHNHYTSNNSTSSSMSASSGGSAAIAGQTALNQLPPPLVPPHHNNVINQNLNAAMQLLSNPLSSTSQSALTTSVSSHAPKSPSPHGANIHVLPTQATSVLPNTQAQLLGTPAAVTSNTSNLMSSSISSAQATTAAANSGGGNFIGLGHLVAGTPSMHSMSTSLHSGTGSGIGVMQFDENVASWNSASSLSPTAIAQTQMQNQRKCEVKLNAMPWFHGSITRDEAEHLLQPREDGLFLVRESTNFPGDYTLCVCYQGKVEHYRVKYLENKLTIDDEEYFENLSQLVAHYEKDADGLCTQLIKCLPKKGKQEYCINSKDFIDKGWVIPESDLQLRESIGKGEFGDVLLGILKNERVAVKMLKDDSATQKFLTEASVMTTLEHENLVKFIGLVFTNKHIYLVTEYMSKGSLVDYLRSRGRQHITKKDQINFAFDTCSGMEYLEAKKVVHRDLAARNVLIAENCVAKVSDFGLAREECYNLDVGKLPIKWTAPEALRGGRFSNKSDMWSFGILLWEIYSFGRVPYPRIPLADVVKHVEVGYKMEAPDGCPTEIYEMMRQAWDLNPTRRPSFHDLKVKLLHFKNITT